MEKTKVRVEIMGRSFTVVSEKSEKYLQKVADEIDKRMKYLKNENLSLSYNDAAILTALNLCDELFSVYEGEKNNEALHKAEEETNRIRSQLVEYSRELSKASTVIKRLEKELNESIQVQEKVKKEYEAKEKELMDMIDSI